MRMLRNINPAIAAIAIVALVAALVFVLIPRGGTRTLTADFPRAVSLYEGSDVKILGIAVGKVTKVTPMGTKVRVEMQYDDKYKVPADAKAAVISPSIVGDRFVQLTPVYTSGPVLADNAKFGTDRTAVPLELDTIFGSLNKLTVALGPDGANKDGALTHLLDTTAKNFGGQGVQFNQTIKDLGKLTKTLADNKDELFGTASEVEKFVNTLAKNDGTVRRFTDSLASGSSMLAADRKDLAAALDNLTTAMTAVRGFVKDNRTLLSSNIKGLTRVTNTVVKRRAQLDEMLRVAPGALNNLALAYDSNSGTLDVRNGIADGLSAMLAQNPVTTVCQLIVEFSGTSKCPLPLPGANRPAALQGGSSQVAGRNTQHVDPTLGGLVGVTR